jgi:hypothetical protein
VEQECRDLSLFLHFHTLSPSLYKLQKSCIIHIFESILKKKIDMLLDTHCIQISDLPSVEHRNCWELSQDYEEDIEALPSSLSQDLYCRIQVSTQQMFCMLEQCIACHLHHHKELTYNFSRNVYSIQTPRNFLISKKLYGHALSCTSASSIIILDKNTNNLILKFIFLPLDVRCMANIMFQALSFHFEHSGTKSIPIFKRVIFHAVTEL